MDKQQVIKKLETIIYPKLGKNIVELKLIDTLHVNSKSLHVKIILNDKQAFNFIAREIPKLFRNDFRDIEVEKKLKETNNKMPYAKKTIVISSAKSGVGKSTVSANLAVTLAQKGYKVGLFDADIYNLNILKLFSLEDKKLQQNENNKISPYEKFNVKIISAGLIFPTNNASLTLENATTILKLMKFFKNIDWGELDFLILNMPSKMSEIHINIAKELTLFGAILVTTPQVLSYNDINHTTMMLKNTNIKTLGVIENMSYFIAPDTKKKYNIFGENKSKKIYKKHNLKLLGQIPINTEILTTLENEKMKKYYNEIIKEVLEEV